jgi:hypothetical protein
MIRTPLLLIICALPSWTQNAHPRIWLDSATTARLTASKNANSAEWQAVKADADKYATWTVPAYDVNLCYSDQICYAWQGFGWYEAVRPLALAYRLTGDSTYSNKLKQILAQMVSAIGNSSPWTKDTAYGTRVALPAIALLFDWTYDALSTQEKTDAISLANYVWGLWANNTITFYDKDCVTTPVNADHADCTASNYAVGHLIGFGLLGLAFEGESGVTTGTVTSIKSWFDAKFAPGFQAGYDRGGMMWQGYNYSPNAISWVMEYLWARRTAGKGDEFASFDYIAPFARRHIYDRTPSNWKAYSSEGDWPGNTSYIMPYFFPMVATLLGTPT